MQANANYRVIVPAAGTGRRMASGIPKQYLEISDKTVIEHTLDALLDCTRIQSIVVVVSADDDIWPGIAARYSGRPLETVTGGEERCHSVLNALAHIARTGDENDWVLVHDAARPCLRPADVDVLIDALEGDMTGGLLGVPVADTMKQVSADGRIEQTVSREGLWHALTPQMFRLGPLHAALEKALSSGRVVTDEAAAMEQAGHRPRIIQGHRENIKITLPADLALAKLYLQARKHT
jgi:2-C-methyl-D-erythritol 4-phosphate cytidylyltransferase